MGYASFFIEDIRPIINIGQGEIMFDFIKKLFGLKTVEAEVAVIEEKAKAVARKVKKVVDVNNDGVINLDDVKEVKKRVYKKAKEVAVVNEVTAVKEVITKVVKKPTPSSSIKKEIQEPVKKVHQKVSSKKRGRKPKTK